jgi:hypothetical protein
MCFKIMAGGTAGIKFTVNDSIIFIFNGTLSGGPIQAFVEIPILIIARESDFAS